MIRTTCPYCGVGCGVLAPCGGGTVAGDPAHPANLGRLCSKGAALGETLSLDGRLLFPEINGRRASWDDAVATVARGFADTIAAHGPGSVGLYVSGQLLTEDYYAANKFAKGFLGTGNIDSNSRLCMSSAVAAHRRAFGEDLVPGIYEDLELADLVVLVGSNTAWCHPVLYQRMVTAGARIVVIDPRRTATCEGAALHIPLAPGTDVALFNGLLAHLWDAGCAAPGTAAPPAQSLAQTAALTGVDAATLATFFAWFAATPRVVTLFSQGVNQSSAGTDKASAIINAHLLTGRIGVPGAGPFSLTGQPNAMGGREVGALANLLAGHLDWDRPGDAAKVAEFWQAPNLAAGPGLSAVDLFDAVGRGQVRALWIIATNPAVSLPAADAVRAALRGCPLVVVSDCVCDTDTADLAHVRLPALAWGEKDGTVTNSERVISRQRAFLPAPGEARPDWWAVAAVARAMGFARGFDWAGPAAIFREHAALSAWRNDGARVFDIGALAHLTDAEYDAMAPTRWPAPAGGPAPARLCATGGRIVPTPFRPPAHATSADWPLVLITTRVRDQWHTMTRTGKSPRLLAHQPEPLVWVHPDDAATPTEGVLIDGALARVSSAWGSGVFRVRLDPGMRPGAVAVPMHWTDRFCPAGRSNPIVNPAVDPISFQPELKHTPVRIAPWPADWFGFVLSRAPLGATLAPWCATLPAAAGVWRHELAGHGDGAAAFAELCARTGSGAWITLRDAGRGAYRGALVADRGLEGCVFVGPDHALPPRDWLVGLFALDALSLAARRALLAGRPAGGPPPEPPVCVCHGVPAQRIRAAIATGAITTDAVGAATRAGTNCGSCKPEIAALLSAALAAAPVLEPA